MTRGAMLLIGLFACAGSVPRTGSSSRTLLIRVHAISSVTDPDGYTIRIDGVAVLEGRWDGSLRRVGVLEGARVVQLGDVSPDCVVEDGPAARPLPASSEREIGVTWQVRCGQVALQANGK